MAEMNIAEKAYFELTEKHSDKEIYVKYNNKFSDYGANIRMNQYKIEARMSSKWKNIDENIQIGLLQELFAKMFKIRKTTMQMDLYNSFVKKLHLTIPKDNSDEILLDSFRRVNEEYFSGLFDEPNLRWASKNFTRLGTYDYKKDLVTISSLFNDAPEEFIDFIMYHELLHKKESFVSKNGRNYYHTKEFRQKEKAFKNKNIEKELKKFIRGKKHPLARLFEW
jgi:predicted metal-dependent hydrolase